MVAGGEKPRALDELTSLFVQEFRYSRHAPLYVAKMLTPLMLVTSLELDSTNTLQSIGIPFTLSALIAYFEAPQSNDTFFVVQLVGTPPPREQAKGTDRMGEERAHQSTPSAHVSAGSDRSTAHAVTVVNQLVFDSCESHAMPLTPSTFDRCTDGGQTGVRCLGAVRVLCAKPALRLVESDKRQRACKAPVPSAHFDLHLP